MKPSKPTKTSKMRSKRAPMLPLSRVERASRAVLADINKETQTTNQLHQKEEHTLVNLVDGRGPRTVRKRTKRQKNATPTADLLDLAAASRSKAVFPPLCLTHTEASARGLEAPALKAINETVDVSFGRPFSSGFRTGNKVVDAMISGYADSSARMPDPFTCVPTFPVNSHYSASCVPTFPATGTTTYGGIAMLLMGSGVECWKLVSLTGGASTVSIAWDTGTAYNIGINSANFVSRPIGINSNLTYTSVGPLHPITITAFPILPDTLSSIAAAPTGWPTTLSSGLTTVQSVWGGRQWQVNPGESVNFITAPLDNRSFDFELSTSARSRYDALGQIAWSGWVIWIWGMTAGDTIGVRTTVGEECAYTNATSTVYNYPQSRVAADPQKASAAKDTFSNFMERGYGAVKYAAEHVAPIVSKAWDLVGRIGALGANNDTNFTGYLNAGQGALVHCLPGPRRHNLPEQKSRIVPQESKELDDCELPNLSESTKTVNALTDAPEMVTPRNARRPSLALSLSSKKR